MGFSELYHFDSSDFMGRVGVYGVSIFYVLSGLTLFMVYHHKFTFSEFYIKRAFRIFPLLWVVLTLTILIHHMHFKPLLFFYNYTGLFGLFAWWRYIGTGVWSIGNELFFYGCFPLLLFAGRTKYLLPALALGVYLIYAWFAFVELLPGKPLANQWSAYINPLNQVGLFLTGFLIGRIFHRIRVNQIIVSGLFAVALLAFIFWPADGNTIALVTGWNRIVFTVISAVICFSFFKLEIRLPAFLDWILRKLGEASYSVYLLHPIVWFVILDLLPDLTPGNRIWISSAVSLVVSYMVFNFFEKPMMRLGRKVYSYLSRGSGLRGYLRATKGE